ncbi:IspD/TarI family cytidylyltransferase [Kaistia adipata]|uniref:IspD/TarI family cytidylyltransferase n=1 Tax=Kaistia adipata TaxID=166954 RepID=UPI0006882273|nr:2-C-methyl-D-erythritol 4-phosphate cytidylyltransferase [Kaistia adipata]
MSALEDRPPAAQALIQAAGSGSRLGLGPKAFVRLDGETLLERSVGLFRSLVESIVIAVPAADLDRARSLVGGPGIILIAGGSTRSETTRRLIDEATATWLILHDVVHPFATAASVSQLLEAARERGASAPGIVNTEYLYRRDGEILHPPGGVLVGQKPVVFSADAVRRAYQTLDAAAVSDDPSLLEVLEVAGIRTAFIEGSARNIKITDPADLELAEAMVALEKCRSGA